MSRAFFSYVGAAVAAVYGYWGIAASLLASGVQSEKQRRARNQARDAYNAGLQDRMVMFDLLPDAPRTLALGRVRAVEGVRRRWVSGTNNDTLTLIVSFAGHEIDGYETWWFQDTPLTLDSEGWVQTEPYLKGLVLSDHIVLTLDADGNGSVTLTSTPLDDTLQALSSNGYGDGSSQQLCTLTPLGGLEYAISGGLFDAECTVTWQYASGVSKARIRPYLGTDDQNIGADLVAQYPDNISATDRFAGIAAAVVELYFDTDVYPQGVVNVNATFRGAKCLDPRTGLTVWTRNPALHASHYARWPWGWDVPLDEVFEQDVIDEANFCDTATTFLLGEDDVDLPRYQCDLVLSTDGDPRGNMEDIMETMAGRWGWAGGTFRFRSGRMKTPVFSMDKTWLAQRLDGQGNPQPDPVVRLTNGVLRDSKINRVTGKCVDPAQRYQVLPFPTVQDDVLIAAEGEYATAVDMAGVAHIAHAQHLASVLIRQSQAALRMEALCTVAAYKCELFDVGTVTLDRYGMGSGKTMEVTGWRWHPTEGVQLSQAEITDDIFVPVDELVGRDPAPNGELPLPWQVEAITITGVTSGTETLVDASIVTRTKVAINAATGASVRIGGHIEFQYTEAAGAQPDDDWPTRSEQGSAVATVIVGLLGGRYYLFRARAINSFGVRGPWSKQVLHRVAQPPGFGAPRLVLSTDRFPVFSFADGTTHVSASPVLTLTAELINLVGTATFGAVAYDVDEASLGPVTLGGSGNTRTLTADQFTAPGVDGSVQRVRVIAALGLPSDYLDVYRDDPTIVGPRLYLSNPFAAVATDALGALGDYTDAVTQAVMFDAGVDVTVDFDWSIVADAGVTALINGGAGPVTGEASIEVAVIDMSIDDGVVLVSGTDGVVTKTRPFRIIKRKSDGSAFRLYFEPREEIVLPLRADGTVASTAEAWTNARVSTADGRDATSAWAYSKEDLGVTSTLVGNRLQITGFLPLGSLGDVISSPIAAPDDWQRAASATWCDDVWVVFGYHASAEYSKVLRSTTFETFSQVDMGTDGHWTRAAYGADKLLAIETEVAGTDRVMRSGDKGVTWTLDHMSQSGEWAHIHFGDAFIATRSDAASGSRSFDGDAFEDVTLPAAGCALCFSAGTWAAVTPAGDLHISNDSGGTWSASKNADMGVPAGLVVSRAVGFIGAIAAALDGPTNLVIASIDHGATWFKLALPGAYSNPRSLQIIKGVLYLVSDDLAVYCTADGLHWFASEDAFGIGSGVPDAIYGAADSIDVDYIADLAMAGDVDAVLSLSFEDGFTDDSPSGHAPTLHNGAVTSAAMARWGTRCFVSDGLMRVTYPSSPDFDFSGGRIFQITLSVYVPTAATLGTDNTLLACWDLTADLGWYLALDTFNQVRFFHTTDGTAGTADFRTISTPIGRDAWKDIAVWLSPTQGWLVCAVDGHIAGTVVTTPMIFGASAVLALAGSSYNTAILPAGVAIDAVRIRVDDIDYDYSDFTPPTTAPGGATSVAAKQQLAATSPDTGFVRVTAEADAEEPLVAAVPVRLGVTRRPLYTASVTPPWLELDSTKDGVVTDFGRAVFTATISDGLVPDTANWSISWTTEHLTPASGTGPVATITGMDVGQDRGKVFFSGEKPGEPLISGAVDVVKNKSGIPSGPIPGATFDPIVFNNTYLGLKFNSDGTWSVKEGASGTYEVQGQWAGAVRAENAAYWLLMEETGPDSFTSGTLDVWLSMAVDREYIHSDASSGTHKVGFVVSFAEDASGTRAQRGFGSTELRVP
jgi:hypothetical protein